MVGFKYLNANPYKSIEGDCVCRAISYASGLSYHEIERKLYYVSKLLDCDALCVDCYEFLLTRYFGYKPIQCDGLSLYEFAEKHKNGLYLVRSNGHISVLDNYNVIDTWDCRSMKLTNAWKIF